MNLFKRKPQSCSCSAEPAPQTQNSNVKILGSGCAKCNELETNVREALAELGMDTTVDHVTDFAQIAAYGVMTTPALVFDRKVLCYGKVLGKNEAKTLIEKEVNRA